MIVSGREGDRHRAGRFQSADSGGAKGVEAGILVINIDNRFDPEVLKSKKLKIPFVGPDNRKGARLAGDYLAKSLKPAMKSRLSRASPPRTNAQQRTLGFTDAMTAIGAKVGERAVRQWEMEKGSAVAASLLNAHPELKALLCDNDSMAAGCRRRRARGGAERPDQGSGL